MQIRPARPDDAEAIAEVWNPFIRDTLVTFTDEQKSIDGLIATLRDKASAGHAFLVAEVDGAVQGFATFGPFRNGPGYRHSFEHTILLAPAGQGRGLGRALMVRLEDAARAAGGHVLMAGVSAANPAGVAFHAAIGFVETARLPEVGRKQGQWLDLVLMHKVLG